MIAGAAAAQMVKEQMEDERRFATDAERRAKGRSGAAADRRRPSRLRSSAAAALRAAAERLEPAPQGRRRVPRRAM